MEKVSGDKKKVKELQQQIDKYELYVHFCLSFDW